MHKISVFFMIIYFENFKGLEDDDRVKVRAAIYISTLARIIYFIIGNVLKTIDVNIPLDEKEKERINALNPAVNGFDSEALDTQLNMILGDKDPTSTYTDFNRLTKGVKPSETNDKMKIIDLYLGQYGWDASMNSNIVTQY